MNNTNQSSALLERMKKGFPTLDDFAQSLHLTTAQRLKVRAAKAAILAYKTLVLPFQQKKLAQLHRDLEQFRNIPLRVPRSGLQAGDDNAYLTEAEIQAFERTGLVRPFRVVSAERAAELRRLADDHFEHHMKDNSFMGREIEAVQKRHNAWSISQAGLYQAQNLKAFRDLLRTPAIAHRLASLMGPEVLCWRSQFFEKRPGATGTFWHQNSVFRESAKNKKLETTQPVDPPIIQLTAWTALSDVTLSNGALRLMPGTFTDGRLEYMYDFARDHLLLFLAQMPAERLDTLLKVAFFSSGSFLRAQGVFNIVMKAFPDILANDEIVDLEMKAGECVIFTSLNLHASYSNTTTDDTRLAFVGRCIANHVKAFPNQRTTTYDTPEGRMDFPLPDPFAFQVYGTDSHGYNKSIPVGE